MLGPQIRAQALGRGSRVRVMLGLGLGYSWVGVRVRLNALNVGAPNPLGLGLGLGTKPMFWLNIPDFSCRPNNGRPGRVRLAATVIQTRRTFDCDTVSLGSRE